MRINQAQLANVLADFTRADGQHFDAGETGYVARQLEHVIAQTYDILKAPKKARLFIPVDSSVPNWAKSYTYMQWDTVGLASLIANAADDLPQVDAFVKEFTAPVRDLGVGYSYTMKDIRAAVATRSRLNEMKARAAVEAVEFKIDELAAFGNSAAGLAGFLNHTAVPLVPEVNGAWDENTTVAEIFEDLDELVYSIPIATKENTYPDTLLLDTVSYGLCTRIIGADYRTTILKAYLEHSPWIKNVDVWHKLDTADAAGTGRRIMAYKRDPLIVQLVIPQEFEQLPPQAKNLSLNVPCTASIGGVSFHYPLGAAYMDLD